MELGGAIELFGHVGRTGKRRLLVGTSCRRGVKGSLASMGRVHETTGGRCSCHGSMRRK